MTAPQPADRDALRRRMAHLLARSRALAEAREQAEDARLQVEADEHAERERLDLDLDP